MTSISGRPAFSPEELRRVEQVDRFTAEGAGGLEPLLAMLSDPSWTVRRAVVAALAARGMEAFPRLCELLRSFRDDETRIAATVDALSALNGDADLALAEMTETAGAPVLADLAQILGRRRTSAGLPALVKLTRHPDDNVAVAAIEALGRIGGRAAVDSLVDAVESGNFFRAFPAIDVLGRSGDPRAVTPLTALLEKPQYAAEATRALGRTGDVAAVMPLVHLFVRSGGATVRVAALALKDLDQRYRERFGNDEAVDSAVQGAAGDPGIVRQLTRALSDGDPPEQAAICFVLGVLREPAAVPVLSALLDASREVADAAAGALRRLGLQAEAQILRGIRQGDLTQRRVLLPLVSRASAGSDVAACLADADPEVRALACEALARLGAVAEVGAIFPLLADPSARVSYAALAAVQSLGSRETERLARAACQSPDPALRRAAVRILSYFGSPSALDDLLNAVSDPDERVREIAIQGLPFLDDPRALEALLAVAKDSSERSRAVAMRSLGRSGEDLRVTAYLLKGLNDADSWVRYYACQALGKRAFEPAAEPLFRLLGDPAGQVRVAAVEALSCLKSELAMDALKKAALDPDSDIQRAALIGLGVSGRADARPLMLEAAKSPDPATRLVAISALGGIDSPEVLGALESAAFDPEENVRTAAIGFLAAMPGEAATRVLAGLLRSAVPTEQILAALSVDADGRIAGLLAALEGADDETAAALTSALARLRRAEATDALLAAMRMPNVAARTAAASALAVLRSKVASAALKRASEEDPEPAVRQICSLLLAR
jgi:HEAT repeat protein